MLLLLNFFRILLDFGCWQRVPGGSKFHVGSYLRGLRLVVFGVKTEVSLERDCMFRIPGIPASLKELTFSQCFPDSVRFSDRFSRNSGGISIRRAEIQQEFRNYCEDIPDRHFRRADRQFKPHAKRARGTVADIFIYIYLSIYIYISTFRATSLRRLYLLTVVVKFFSHIFRSCQFSRSFQSCIL